MRSSPKSANSSMVAVAASNRALFTITGREVRVLHIRHAAREALSAEDLAEDL